MGRCDCESWSLILANTGKDWGNSNPLQESNPTLKQRLSLIKTRRVKTTNINLTLKNPDFSDIGTYVLGAWKYTGSYMQSRFSIIITKPKTNTITPSPKSGTSSSIFTKHSLIPSFRQEVTIERGYEDKNIWLDWIHYTVNSAGVTDCFACSSARPTLFTTPAPLLPDLNPLRFHCMLAIHMTLNPTNCSALSFLFPVTSNTTTPPVFMPKEDNYTCLTGSNVIAVGIMRPSLCNMTINVTSWSNMSQLLISRADLFWYCGGRRLWNVLPQSWSGTCTQVSLTLPLLIMGHHKDPKQMRVSRSVQTDFDLIKNSPTYVDATVANGFESLLFWITPKKKVDRINYVHYNVQRLANLTRDVVVGHSEQLLDMLLAERGGVCSMFGSACCTFIPKNTAPDGSVTRALQGLKTLSTKCLIITALSKEQTPPPYQIPLLETHGLKSDDEKKVGKEEAVL
uniref:Uncharacterized protein n=1 Tax=Mola mola TaxID=94237 RepID=A0A3Q3XF83_MOLML